MIENKVKTLSYKKTNWLEISISIFVLIALLYVLFFANITKAVNPTLSLSPTSNTVGNNQTFNVDIVIDTAGLATDGVDIYSLHFNPSILQVVDADGAQAGVQISPGTRLPITVINTVDNTSGTIQFSQAASGGTSFSGSGTLATITFRGVGGGTSSVTFDYGAGNTSDTNIAFQGNDLLGGVTNGSYTVDATGPTVSITNPFSGATVSGSSVTVSANASDNVGVSGVQFKLDGSNLGSEDTSSPYTITWNASGVSNGSHTLTAVARDAAGNTTTSSAISVTVNNADVTAPTVSITAPTTGSTVSGSAVTVSATASDNIGVAGVQFKLDGSNLGSEDTSSPYSISWNSTTASDGSHTLSATARDAAGNTANSLNIPVTVTNVLQRTIQIDLEGRTNDTITATLSVLNSSKTFIKSYTVTTNSLGTASISFDISPQVVYLKLNPIPFLTRLLSVDLNTNTTYTFPKILIGDINQDNIINSIDYSLLNTKWFTADATSDLNKDGIVNSIDFSYMNQHWLLTGEV